MKSNLILEDDDNRVRGTKEEPQPLKKESPSTVKRYRVIGLMEHGGKQHAIGSIVELDASAAEYHIKNKSVTNIN